MAIVCEPTLIFFTETSNSISIELDEVQSDGTRVPLNTATVTATLTDKVTGAEITGETWPVALSYVPMSDGRYVTTLSETLDIIDGQLCELRYDVDGGVDLKRVVVRDVYVEQG